MDVGIVARDWDKSALVNLTGSQGVDYLIDFCQIRSSALESRIKSSPFVGDAIRSRYVDGKKKRAHKVGRLSTTISRKTLFVYTDKVTFT